MNKSFGARLVPGLVLVIGLILMARAAISQVTDTVPPDLSILSHPSESYTTDPNITINGTCQDNSTILLVEVRLNTGGWTPCEGTSDWALNLTLEHGWNDIVVRATDSANNTSTAEIGILYEYDYVPPPDPSGSRTADMDDLLLIVGVLGALLVVGVAAFLYNTKRK